jgi:hypothetical protein
MLSFSLKLILDPNFVPLFWRLLVSEFLLGVFAISHCSVSAPPVKFVPPQDVHRLLMLFARLIPCSDLGTFPNVRVIRPVAITIVAKLYNYINKNLIN